MKFVSKDRAWTGECSRKRQLLLISIWVLTGLAVLPAIFHWAAHAPAVGSGRSLRIALANVLALAICYAIYRTESRRLPRTRALALVFLIFLLTALVNFMHKVSVDYGPNHFTTMSNLEWQEWMQKGTMDLSPLFLPNSYRFLPNSIVRWMEIAGVSFPAARNLYRLYFGLLIFYALYRYARLYTNFSGAIIAMLLTAAIYPVSFQHYAGQLTDPLSHLSFLLCFIFLEVDDFALFLSAMLIGSLAKETVLAMAGYYVLFCRRDRRHLLNAGIALGSGAIAYVGVRLLVLRGGIGYHEVSGVPLTHVLENWHEPNWRGLFLLTACALMPILAVGWRETPLALKRQALFLLPVLFVSSLFFSWLVESRNFMPLVFVLAVIAGNFLSSEFGLDTDSSASATEYRAKTSFRAGR